MSNSLVVEELERAVVVRFNRPEIRNPLSVDVLCELHRIIGEQVGSRTLIFAGTDGVFASGADLREISAVAPESAREFSLRGQSLMTKISGLRAVAAITGYCFGGALDLVLACRTRIASSAAVFSHPGANLGIITGWGGTQRLPRLVGQANALEMFLTARRVYAEEALRIGLIDSITDDPLDVVLNSLDFC